MQALLDAGEDKLRVHVGFVIPSATPAADLKALYVLYGGDANGGIVAVARHTVVSRALWGAHLRSMDVDGARLYVVALGMMAPDLASHIEEEHLHHWEVQTINPLSIAV